METKICGVCKNEYPKTNEYFHTKKYNQKLANGDIATYTSFRYDCKKCHKHNTNIKRIKKICKEKGWEVSEYRQKWIEEKIIQRTKYKEIIGLSEGRRQYIRQKIDKGYVFTTLDQYKLDCKKNISKARRKYDYGDVDFIPKKANQGIKHLTDGYIALCLKQKVADVPKEIIETKRLSILIKRELENLNK